MKLAESANHHFVPQFYLRGFSELPGRQARVFTFDNKTKKSFTTLVRNVASRRYFNRIDVDGVDPNIVENMNSKVESEMANDLSDVIKEKRFPTERHFENLINLMASVSVRNPRLRNNISEFHEGILQKMMNLIVSSEGSWKNVINNVRTEGIPINEDITFEDIKNFVESKDYNIIIKQNYLIGLELQMVDPVFKTMINRNWCFVESSDDNAFITSDDPVVLSWSDDKDRGFYSPGHGLSETMVFFSLSPKLAIMGTFEEIPDNISYDSWQTTCANTHIARYSGSQIYARDSKFLINLKNITNVMGSDLSRILSKNS
jgi:hypothetical protein